MYVDDWIYKGVLLYELIGWSWEVVDRKNEERKSKGVSVRYIIVGLLDLIKLVFFIVWRVGRREEYFLGRVYF